METHRLALVAGYRLEQYQIERILGKGGFGITYVAIDTHLGKRLAIKELLPDSIATRVEGSTVVPQTTSMEDSWAWAKDRFLEEARFLAGFSHPAIVGVHRLLEANGTAYMVMDYVEGESYEARLRRIGKEPDQASLMAVMGPIMEGIEELHAKNLLHRDIKPDNILIDKRGKPVLIDFGSARTSVGATMTMTSMVTHGYSPIEQYQTKGKMGPWTDIYAIGAVMCRAITGEKPPVAADRVIEDDFEWVSNRKPAGYDDTFLNAVDWALRVRVEDRPQSIANFSEHLSVVRAATPPPIPAKLEQSPKIPAEEKKPIKKPKALTTVRKKHKVIAAQSILLISAFIIYLFAENNLKEIKARISEREKTYLSEAEKAANAAELFLAEAELASNSSLATPLPFIFKLDPPSRLYTVNFGAVVAKLGESNYMRTNFEIQSSSNKIEQIIDDNKTSLTEAVIAVLSSQSVDALHSEDGREVVRKNLINKFNKILGDKFVDQISFTEFIIQ